MACKTTGYKALGSPICFSSLPFSFPSSLSSFYVAPVHQPAAAAAAPLPWPCSAALGCGQACPWPPPLALLLLPRRPLLFLRPRAPEASRRFSPCPTGHHPEEEEGPSSKR